jgi:hypothetical protein
VTTTIFGACYQSTARVEEHAMTIAQTIGRISAQQEMTQKAREFTNLARVVALSRGDHAMAQQLAQRNLLGPRIKTIFENHHRVYEMRRDVVARLKAAVSAGTTTDNTWALPLAEYDVLADAFLASLKNYGAFDAMLPSMRRVPFRTRIGASTSGASGNTVPQASVKPISKLTLTGTQIDEQKALAILVITNELARFGDVTAGDLFAAELSNAVAVETDETFVSVLTAAAPSFTSNGATAEHARLDLRVLLTAITTNARSQLFLLVTPGIAKTLAVLSTNAGDEAFPNMNYNGGLLSGIPTLVSDGVPSQTMVLVDAQQVAAASETIQLSAATETTVQLDTAPDSPVSGSTTMTSLWQSNLTVLKAERVFGAQKLTGTGVAVMTSVNYTGDSPGP